MSAVSAASPRAGLNEVVSFRSKRRGLAPHPHAASDAARPSRASVTAAPGQEEATDLDSGSEQEDVATRPTPILGSGPFHGGGGLARRTVPTEHVARDYDPLESRKRDRRS
jgi:hypothetical protein